MNRMGLNGDPAEAIVGRLAKVATPLFGVNVAKTHSPDILGDAAIDDICAAYRLVRPFGLYTAINISCPNTAEGRTFEDPAPLAELLSALNAIRRDGGHSPPLMVKLSPVLDPGMEEGREHLDAALAVCADAGVDGYICCNTLPFESPNFGRGGLSGEQVRFKAFRIIEHLVKAASADKRPAILGCGGIFKGRHLDGYIARGCVAAQAYNGFVRGPLAGVRFAHRVLREYAGKIDF